MNYFDTQIMTYTINISQNEDNSQQIIKKQIYEFKNEINRVKTLPYYKGEDDYIINDIEKIITKKYTQHLLNIFFTLIRLKIKCIQFRKRYYQLYGLGYNKLYNKWG